MSLTQSELYLKIITRNLIDDIKDNKDNNIPWDLLKVAEINEIHYYIPNDEEEGTIIALSHQYKIAHITDFFEMDDMEYPDSDYIQVVYNNELMCRFEVPQ